MNIGHMARAFGLEMQKQPQEAKSLELRDGQVVRGVVLQLLDGEEALVAVNGTRIRAKLETPLQVGQAAWLQVQPSDAEGRLVLRTLALAVENTTDDYVVRLLQQLGLKDTALNREIVRQAQALNIPLDAKQGRVLAEFIANSQQSSSGEAARWIQSVLIAQQRGLPLTEQTVNGVMQALHGRPLPEQLMTLQTQLTQWTAANGGSASSMPEAARQILVKLADAIQQFLSQANVSRLGSGELSEAGGRVWSQGQALAGTGVVTGNGTGNPAGNGAANATAIGNMGSQQLGQSLMAAAAARPVSGADNPVVTPTVNGQGAASPVGGNQSPAPAAASTANVLISQAEQSIARDAGSMNTPVRTDASTAANGQSIARAGEGGAQAQIGAGNSAATQQAGAGQNSSLFSGTMLRQLLNGLGFNHEHSLMEKLILQQQPNQAREGANQPLGNVGGQTAAGSETVAPGGLQAQQLLQADTVKSLLLQAAALEQLPAALREALQQAAQTITGQQLLMTADRTATFTHITMFIPFFDEDGRQLASVHIQTRQGKRNQLDSENCHLLFDLRLAQLGETIVDVQVTERIVALRVYCEHPLIEKLVEQGREPLQHAFEELGYRLSYMKSMPLAEQERVAAVETEGMEATGGLSPASLRRFVSGNTYRGVDLRI